MRIALGALTLLPLLAASPRADACTTFCQEQEGSVLVGKSYDWDQEQGLLLVNKRGVKKRALTLKPNDRAAEWVSKYGSITFNQYGREMPNGGMNEAGLVVEVMWLDETQYGPPDQRPAINELQWIQMQLDRFATVAEVVREADAVRISPENARLHYLVCDRSAACAAFEVLSGKLVVTTGAAMPAKVLANDTYAQSKVYLGRHRGFGGAAALRAGAASLDRFVRAASRVLAARKAKEPVEAAFATLDSVSQGDYSKWHLVYDPVALRVHFRTRGRPERKLVAFAGLDFSCKTPVKMFDLAAPQSGDVQGALRDYDRAANQKLLEQSLAPLAAQLPKGAVALLARYPESMTCEAPASP